MNSRPSAISAINKGLDESLKAFAERRLGEAYPYLILDARYERAREAGVIDVPAPSRRLCDRHQRGAAAGASAS